MAESLNPLTPDPRVIPIPISLAICLSYLPGIDPKPRVKKAKPKGKKRIQDTLSMSAYNRGIQRAMILVEVYHKLMQAERTDVRLAIVDGVRWYARSYEDWASWDFRCIPLPTLKRTFQQLNKAGLLMGISSRRLIDLDAKWAPYKRFLQLLSVYNLKAWTVNRDKLDELMAASPQVQAYFASFKEMPVSVSAETALPPDRQKGRIKMIRLLKRSMGSDQNDPGGRIRLIRGSDQIDPRGRIRLILPWDQIDPRSASTDHQLDQLENQPSSSSAAPRLDPADSGTGDDQPEPAAPAEPDAAALELLAKYGITGDAAKDIASSIGGDCVKAWTLYMNKRDFGKNPIDDKAGYLIRVLKPGAWPPGHEKNTATQAASSEPAGKRYLAGRFANEIKS